MDAPSSRGDAFDEAPDENGASASGALTSVTCADYSPTQERVVEVDDVAAFLAQHRPEWSAVRWINVVGLGDRAVIRGLAEKYELHPLSIEDLRTPDMVEGVGVAVPGVIRTFSLGTPARPSRVCHN